MSDKEEWTFGKKEQLLETLKATYVDAKDNKKATIHLKIKRRQTCPDNELQNDTKGKQKGMRASNEVQKKFIELKEAFIKYPASYKKPHGAIVNDKKEGTKYRIDQQTNDRTKHNIQFQVFWFSLTLIPISFVFLG